MSGRGQPVGRGRAGQVSHLSGRGRAPSGRGGAPPGGRGRAPPGGRGRGRGTSPSGRGVPPAGGRGRGRGTSPSGRGAPPAGRGRAPAGRGTSPTTLPPRQPQPAPAPQRQPAPAPQPVAQPRPKVLPQPSPPQRTVAPPPRNLPPPASALPLPASAFPPPAAALPSPAPSGLPVTKKFGGVSGGAHTRGLPKPAPKVASGPPPALPVSSRGQLLPPQAKASDPPGSKTLYRHGGAATPWQVALQVPLLAPGQISARAAEDDVRLRPMAKDRKPVPRIRPNAWKLRAVHFKWDVVGDMLTLSAWLPKSKPRGLYGLLWNYLLIWRVEDPSPADKDEGRPYDYFDLDNCPDHEHVILSGNQIQLKAYEKKLNVTMTLPSDDAAKVWFDVLQRVVLELQTASRADMQDDAMVEARVEEMTAVFPLNGFAPKGKVAPESVTYANARMWFDEMRGHHEKWHEFAPYCRKISLFVDYHLGKSRAFCDYFFGRNMAGVEDILDQTRKAVFASWKDEVDRIIALAKNVLSDDYIDRLHLPFHMEDCTIGFHYLELMRGYNAYVHGVPGLAPDAESTWRPFAEVEAELKQLHHQLATHASFTM